MVEREEISQRNVAELGDLWKSVCEVVRKWVLVLSVDRPDRTGTKEVVLDESQNASEIVDVGKGLPALTRRARNVATVGAVLV